MPKHRKVKFQPQTKKKKTKHSQQPVEMRREETAVTGKAAAVAPQAAVKAPVAEAVAVPVEKPELVFELRRIGILGAAMLVALIILALIL